MKKQISGGFHRMVYFLVRLFRSEAWLKDGRCPRCGSGELRYDEQIGDTSYVAECLVCGHEFPPGI